MYVGQRDQWEPRFLKLVQYWMRGQYTVSYPELWTGVWEQVDLPKVVPSNQEALIIGPADSVDVGAVWAVGPQAWGAETTINWTIKHKHTPREKEVRSLHLPKTWKPRGQVWVAHSMSLVVSTLTTCLHTDGIPRKRHTNKVHNMF